jgi:hypothetical protein
MQAMNTGMGMGRRVAQGVAFGTGVAVAGALIQMIPDPSAAFADFADLPVFPAAGQVQDGLARLEALTSELHGALVKLLGRYSDAMADGAAAPLDSWTPEPDTSSALWDSIYQELCDLYVVVAVVCLFARH